MNSKSRIVVVGSLVFDFVARANRLPRKGETVMGDSFGMFTGGKGANQAVQASRLGAEVYMVGRVGNDFLGEKLLTSLNESGVNTEFIIKDNNASTAACCIHVDSRGDNSIIIVPEANMACTREDVANAEKVIKSADIVLCQLEISIPAIKYAVDLTHRYGKTLILNPAPAREVPKGLFSKADILTPNETEAEFFTGIKLEQREDEEWESKVSDKLLSMGSKTVIITLGKRGAYFANRENRKMMPTYDIPAVDTTAAGDAFNGALAVGLSEGMETEEAVAFANGAGALAASKEGAQSSLCSRECLDELLHSQGM